MRILQTREEVANSLTHFSGMILVPVVMTYLLIRRAQVLSLHSEAQSDWQSLFGVLAFCIAAFLMYTASTVYHWTLPGRAKQCLRYFDHINIYLLIAASYTPILLLAVGGVLGWVMFGIMWGLALLGTFYKLFFLGKYPKLSLALYLCMGWSVVFIAEPVWQRLPTLALWFLLAEGLFYSTGCYFYANDKKHAYFHAIWHLFVLAGTLSHFAVIWLIL